MKMILQSFAEALKATYAMAFSRGFLISCINPKYDREPTSGGISDCYKIHFTFGAYHSIF